MARPAYSRFGSLFSLVVLGAEVLTAPAPPFPFPSPCPSLPQVTLGEGAYTIARTAAVSEHVYSHCMRLLNEYDVMLEGILLKVIEGGGRTVVANES